MDYIFPIIPTCFSINYVKNKQKKNTKYTIAMLVVQQTYLLYQLNIIRPPILVPNKGCKVYPTKGRIICSNYSFKILPKYFTVHLKNVNKKNV